jgi:hypothetical protein
LKSHFKVHFGVVEPDDAEGFDALGLQLEYLESKEQRVLEAAVVLKCLT